MKYEALYKECFDGMFFDDPNEVMGKNFYGMFDDYNVEIKNVRLFKAKMMNLFEEMHEQKIIVPQPPCDLLDESITQ